MILDEFGTMSLELFVGWVKQDIGSRSAIHKYVGQWTIGHVVVTDLSGHEEWVGVRVL